MQIQRNNLALAASPISSAQGMASGTAVQSGQRDVLASLRQIRATGRIVLKFSPESSGVSNLPDIALEDGDSFTVPSVPATVIVPEKKLKPSAMSEVLGWSQMFSQFALGAAALSIIQ